MANTKNSDDKRHQDNLDSQTSSKVGEMGGEKRAKMADNGEAMSFEEMGTKAHDNGAHEFKKGSEEAREAGRKGGQNSHGGGRTSDDDK